MTPDLEPGQKRKWSLMKKVLVGVAVFVVLVMLAAGAGLVWLIRQSREMMRDVQGRQVTLIATNTDFPFTAPADGQLTEERFQAWLQTASRFRELDRAHLEGMRQTTGHRSIAEAMRTGLSIVPNRVTDLEEALRASKMSLEEFGWILHRLQGTLHHDAATKRPALASIMQAVDDQVAKTTPPAFLPYEAPPIPTVDDAEAERVLDIIERHRDDFEAVAPAILGDPFLRQIVDRGGLAVPGT
jgi:hypothetical protein